MKNAVFCSLQRTSARSIRKQKTVACRAWLERNTVSHSRALPARQLFSTAVRRYTYTHTKKKMKSAKSAPRKSSGREKAPRAKRPHVGAFWTARAGAAVLNLFAASFIRGCFAPPASERIKSTVPVSNGHVWHLILRTTFILAFPHRSFLPSFQIPISEHKTGMR